MGKVFQEQFENALGNLEVYFIQKLKKFEEIDLVQQYVTQHVYHRSSRSPKEFPAILPP